MDTEIEKAYAKFSGYVARLRGDLRQVAERMPPQSRALFNVPEYSFEWFAQRWRLISADETLLRSWTARLEPGGDDAERQKLETLLRNAFDGLPETGRHAA